MGDNGTDAGVPDTSGLPDVASPGDDAGEEDTAVNPTPDADPTPDAGPAPDAAVPDAAEDTGPEPGPDTTPQPGAAETCAEARPLFEISEEIEERRDIYTHRLVDVFGQSNDYNPYMDSGQEPGCSLVFDAMGNEVVYQIGLEPGQTLEVQLVLEPATSIPAVYVTQGCPIAGWPDLDESGLCGSNEYFTEGFCPIGNCAPMKWSYTWPTSIGGRPTDRATLFLVLDEIGAAAAEGFELQWTLVDAQ